MTIELNFKTETLVKDLKTLIRLFDCESDNEIENISTLYDKLNVSLKEFENNIKVHVTLKEFSYIGVFNKGIN